MLCNDRREGGKASRRGSKGGNDTRKQIWPEDKKRGFTVRLKTFCEASDQIYFLEAFDKIDCLAAGNQSLTIKGENPQNWRKSAQFRVFSCAKNSAEFQTFFWRSRGGWRRIPTHLCYTFTILYIYYHIVTELKNFHGYLFHRHNSPIFIGHNVLM